MKYIIGCGIAGLVFAYYNSSFIIITKEVGGQMSHKIPLGPRLLQCCKYTEKLLKDLNVKTEKKIAKIGYCVDNKIYDTPPNNFKEEYLKITRNKKAIGENCSMSETKNRIEYYDVNFDIIIEKLLTILSKNGRIILNEIVQINETEKIIICSKTTYKYNNLVSTIPFTVFSKYLKFSNTIKSKNLKTKPITFTILNDTPIDMKDYNYVYFIDRPYYRVTKFKTCYIYENIGFGSFAKTVNDCCTLNNGKIVDGIVINKDKNISFLGRFAEWKQEIKTQQIIQKSLEFGI